MDDRIVCYVTIDDPKTVWPVTNNNSLPLPYSDTPSRANDPPIFYVITAILICAAFLIGAILFYRRRRQLKELDGYPPSVPPPKKLTAEEQAAIDDQRRAQIEADKTLALASISANLAIANTHRELPPSLIAMNGSVSRPPLSSSSSSSIPTTASRSNSSSNNASNFISAKHRSSVSSHSPSSQGTPKIRRFSGGFYNFAFG